ncbi:hypothetical protein ATCC90586_006218 [Pythium insidiosum]|nr:hypothetical protein ATCC90586_006218 [Pythium insidiosum]
MEMTTSATPDEVTDETPAVTSEQQATSLTPGDSPQASAHSSIPSPDSVEQLDNDGSEGAATANAVIAGENEPVGESASSTEHDVTPQAAPMPSPPTSSSGGVSLNDLIKQLRVWKERSTRLEALLTKKSAKLQEMEETETKLKRLLAMAKRSIDNSKQELAEKDAEIEQLREEVSMALTSIHEEKCTNGVVNQLRKKVAVAHSWEPDDSTRAPRRVIYKVAHGSVIWCYVEYASEHDLDAKRDYAWHRFHSEEQVKAYAALASGEPLVIPALSLTPFEVERVKKDLKEEIDRVQEEFRRYRVRAEITRKQKDAELKKMSANAVARQAEQISETDLSGELQSARAQIRRLTKQNTETEEREADWRRKFEKLYKDYEKLSGTMGETVLATEWRERYEQAVKDKEASDKKLEELRSTLATITNGSDGSSRGDYAQFRRRDPFHGFENGGGGSADSSRSSSYKDLGPPRSSGGPPARPLRRMSSNNSLGGLEVPNVTTTNEYLKNIVYKYMTTEQDEAREHMEKAIATVLNFSPSEVTAVQERRKAQAGWFW